MQTDCVTWYVWQVYWLTICLILACVSSKINARICHTMYRCNLSASMCARIVSRHSNSSIAHSCVSSEWRSTSNSHELEKISERHGVFPGNLSSRFTFNYMYVRRSIFSRFVYLGQRKVSFKIWYYANMNLVNINPISTFKFLNLKLNNIEKKERKRKFSFIYKH